MTEILSMPTWQIFSDKRYSVLKDDLVEYSYKNIPDF